MAKKEEWRNRRWGIGLMLGLALFGLLPLTAQAEDTRQYKIEAAFLYNFFNYITWPGQSDTNTLKEATICVKRGDPIVPYLDYVRVKMASKRALAIREVTESSAGCHLMFVRGEVGTTNDDTLTVSARDDSNAMVTLQRQESNIGIRRINQSTLQSHGFKVSSRLLSLAGEVR